MPMCKKCGLSDFKTERYKMIIPTLSSVWIEEYECILTNRKIINGTLLKRTDRHFVSIAIEENIRLGNKIIRT